MSFHLSSTHIKLKHHHVIEAKLRTPDGNLREDDFDLDRVVGNSHGKLVWNSSDFSKSAKDISLQQAGDGTPPVLRAWVGDGQGGHNYVELNLGEKIANKDGHFHYEP
ncbi:hypothetical protein KEM55_006373 [Ascosphaera atra]|nr:hypothetical protein KEM55_006373 [Ascosphaera atra]